MTGNLVGAAFCSQIIDKILQHPILHGANQSRLLAPLKDHSGRFQVCDVVRQGGAWNIQLLLNLAHGETIIACAH